MRVRHRLKHLHVIVGGTDQQPGALPVTSAAPLAPKASNNSNPYHMVYRQLLKCTWEPAFQRYYRHFQRGLLTLNLHPTGQGFQTIPVSGACFDTLERLRITVVFWFCPRRLFTLNQTGKKIKQERIIRITNELWRGLTYMVATSS